MKGIVVARQFSLGKLVPKIELPADIITVVLGDHGFRYVRRLTTGQQQYACRSGR